ncbi:hypothetical protein H5410_010784 [Solanum commersonii]|uniref:Uncharacterized protein n=1 Tax=Solanum commersonii TaxID=4109 RepID=A0A9J6ALR1_SOLCO|nr:hypothetical protein H5410_010784 [Solanum commersonii]
MLAKNNLGCSNFTDFPNSNSQQSGRNNNVLDHVAMQNETTGNKHGKANAYDNGLAPHHIDTISRVCQ